MNKQEVISTYHSLLRFLRNMSQQTKHLPGEKVWVSAGAALVMMDLTQETNDLDVSVNEAVWNLIERPVEEVKNGDEIIKFKTITSNLDNPNQPHVRIDVHVGDNPDVQLLDGVWVAKFDYLMAERKRLGREKDKTAMDLLITDPRRKVQFVTALHMLSEQFQLDIRYTGMVASVEFEIGRKTKSTLISQAVTGGWEG